MKKSYYILISLVFMFSVFGLQWEQMFPELNSYRVTEIKQGSITNVGNYGYVFCVNDSTPSKMAYYNYSQQLEFVSGYNGLPVKSIAFDNHVTDSVYIAYGYLSGSDGHSKYDMITGTSTRKSWAFMPKFIKYLNSGFYLGSWGQVYHSEDGTYWQVMDEFSTMDDSPVSDIVENTQGILFTSSKIPRVTNEVMFMKNGDILDSLNTGMTGINDLYKRTTPNGNDILFSVGDGSYSDGLYRILYNDSTIIGFELIDYIPEANLITEHIDSYIVTCKNSADMYIVPFSTGIARQHVHGLDINNIYCISRGYPIYTPNFLIGTDKGVFMATGTTSIENGEWRIENYKLQQNYPNPFNNETVIPYELQADSDVKINIFNSNGEQVKQISLGKMNKGTHEYKLSTENFSAGQYFYTLSINGEVAGRKKMLYLR